MTIEESDLRWLEIIFYCFCKGIFNKTQKVEAVEDFIYGFRWTNTFDYDKLIKAIKEENILFDTNFIPKKYEFAIIMTQKTKFKIVKPRILHKLANLVNIKCELSYRYRTKLKEEIKTTELFPKLRTRNIHREIYGFLKAIKQFGDYSSELKL